MIALLIGGGALVFVVAYLWYGRFLDRLFDLQGDRAPTPAHLLRDDKDYSPAKLPVLLGHHFSSIAGAGPIVGPIFGTSVFGWLPAVLWIVLGSIFIGGVHDYGSLAVSLKNRGQSIASAAARYLSPLAGKLFLAFVWLALVYVLVVFLDLTAATFVPSIPPGTTSNEGQALIARGAGVASSSVMFVVFAILFGLLVYRFKIGLGRASLIFVPAMFVAVYLGQQFPIMPAAMPQIGLSAAALWRVLLVVYCFAASVLPVWLLLQPRDYLSSYLLYVCLGGGVLGALLSPLLGQTDMAIHYPAFLGFHGGELGYLFPALFITIACGACSGFHSIVASGTTVKQLDRERDARPVSYGAMLIEGMLALLSIATIAVVEPGSAEAKLPPPAIFALGLSRFFAEFGVPAELGQAFGMLALSTFLLTTLDTATRLGRYVFGELFKLEFSGSAWFATAMTVALPLAVGLMTFRDELGRVVPAWQVIWPVFGATNQLLGGLALIVVSAWLRHELRSAWPTLLPMAFMVVATLVALIELIVQHGLSLVGCIAAILFILAVVVMVEAARTMLVRPGVRPS
jgi:carbon starvation protein